jgi:hypothetical protein
MTIKIEDAGQDNLKQSSLDEELLKIIASQVKSSPYAICLAMGIIAYMIYRHIPEQPLLWGGWMSLVILISGDTAPDRLQQASKAGIPLLSKPAVKDELCAAIASALQDTPGK